MRTIGVVSTSRADYGIYRPLLRAIADDPDLELSLMVGGMHLAPEFGLTARAIEADGFAPAERVEMLLSSDTAQGTALSMGLGVMNFAQALARRRPEILVVLGDRFEMFAAGLAATALGLPLAHIHGGELSLGAMDDSLRHGLTKLAHLHFVACPEYARRVRQMGEEPWRVTVCGALSLDNLAAMELLDRAALEARLGLGLERPPLLVTFHPATLEPGQAVEQVNELLAALEALGRPAIFTLPNADAGGREVAAVIRDFAGRHPWAAVRDNLGAHVYFSLMAQAAAMVGNSSSGIIEAPSFGLPVVNVGSRQEGRLRAANVLDVECRRQALGRTLDQALSPVFRAGLAGLANPFQQGGAAGLIVDRLKTVDLGPRLLRKRFVDWPDPEGDR